jgi:hypothetical protein
MIPRQRSADGMWEWDGTRWVPTPHGLAPSPGGLPATYLPQAPTNSLAIVSLVAGILSWVLCPIIAAIVAVITGHIARRQMRYSGESGGGLALAGLVLGYVHLVFWIVGFVLWLRVLGGIAIFSATSSH